MDTKNFLDQLLQSGKELAQKGQAMAENKLNIPAEGEQREAMLSGIKTGAAAAGVLALLLGTQADRRVTGAAVKVGGLAALGGLAYQMYRQWEKEGAANESGSPQLEAPMAPKADVGILLKAMIAAAKADGHVDAAELETIRQKLAGFALEGDVNDMIMEELATPLDANDVAAMAQGDMAVAAEIYLISAAIIDQANEAEQSYLDDLKAALNLPSDSAA